MEPQARFGQCTEYRILRTEYMLYGVHYATYNICKGVRTSPHANTMCHVDAMGKTLCLVSPPRISRRPRVPSPPRSAKASIGKRTMKDFY